MFWSDWYYHWYVYYITDVLYKWKSQQKDHTKPTTNWKGFGAVTLLWWKLLLWRTCVKCYIFELHWLRYIEYRIWGRCLSTLSFLHTATEPFTDLTITCTVDVPPAVTDLDNNVPISGISATTNEQLYYRFTYQLKAGDEMTCTTRGDNVSHDCFALV